MKKAIALLLSGCMLAGLLAGCGDGGKTGGKTVVTFWTQDTVAWQNYFEPAIERFEKEHEDIDIQVEYFSDFADKLSQAMSANQEANVIFTYSSIGEYADAGKIQEVPSSVYSKEDIEKTFLEGAIANKQHEGKY